MIVVTTEQNALQVQPKVLTPIKAIRAKCLDCMCFSATEVRKCSNRTCSLNPYRLGKRPSTGQADEDEGADE